MFRDLKAEEVEIRVGKVGEKGATLLLYKDARADMTILDEIVGPFNWKREHSRDNANCTVSIWDKEKEQWISKEDTGAESFTEKEKGLASDSFKRACFNWGIGRELYTAPLIFVKCEVKTEANRYVLKNKYEFSGVKVKELKVENGKITGLKIANSKGEQIFQYPFKNQSQGKKEVVKEEDILITKVQSKRMFAVSNGNAELCKEAIHKFGYEKSEEVQKKDYDSIIYFIENRLKNGATSEEITEDIQIPSDEQLNDIFGEVKNG